MEMEDLMAKWTEIQQTKLSKESRHVLRSAATVEGDRDRSTSGTGSYLQLDTSSKSANDYLNHKTDELNAKLTELVSADGPYKFNLKTGYTLLVSIASSKYTVH